MTKEEFEKRSCYRITSKQFEIINEWYKDDIDVDVKGFVEKVSMSIIIEISEAYLTTYQNLIGVVMDTLSTMGRCEIEKRVRKRYAEVKLESLNAGVHVMCALSCAYSDVIDSI